MSSSESNGRGAPWRGQYRSFHHAPRRFYRPPAYLAAHGEVRACQCPLLASILPRRAGHGVDAGTEPGLSAGCQTRSSEIGKMTLRVVGAGLGRTGTTSLKAALEFLLKAPCYHMDEVYAHPEHVEVWRSALRGDSADLSALMEGYAASVDWPAGAFWRELSSLFPHALFVLTVRESAEAWWRSANATILEKNRQPVSPKDPLAVSSGMIEEMMSLRFTPDWNDRESALAAYERHNESVRQAIAPGRLLEWKAGDGWEPLCARLEVPVPKTAFPTRIRPKSFAG